MDAFTSADAKFTAAGDARQPQLPRGRRRRACGRASHRERARRHRAPCSAPAIAGARRGHRVDRRVRRPHLVAARECGDRAPARPGEVRRRPPFDTPWPARSTSKAASSCRSRGRGSSGCRSGPHPGEVHQDAGRSATTSSWSTAFARRCRSIAATVRALADRRFGVGCDQVLRGRAAAQGDADFRYRIFNADGGEVEQCGNGARCFVVFVRDHGLTDKREIRVETASGRHRAARSRTTAR